MNIATYAVCPFYKHSFGNCIYCEYLKKEHINKISMDFYAKIYCCKLDGMTHCENYIELMKPWEKVG